ncbi:MAG: type II toxin-antitoxin system VapC family toxin [Deltaproteobacteria bacterium]|nr:type II toxin-antitoxin system VapC family toxin [Deltaproteobacteria bacterium]MBW2137895.1 type II toxin-antitoxin system VapC family toxin [Deltaproteobacteria bacterium]
MPGPYFVVDASVTLGWAFEDETSPYTEAVLEALTEGSAFAPAIWPLEVSNALVVAERRGRLTKADTIRFLALLRQLPIEVEGDVADRIFSEVLNLAREHGLSSYDASYLDLAMRLGLPLATQDEALQQAATRCGVEIFGKERVQ